MLIHLIFFFNIAIQGYTLLRGNHESISGAKYGGGDVAVYI